MIDRGPPTWLLLTFLAYWVLVVGSRHFLLNKRSRIPRSLQPVAVAIVTLTSRSRAWRPLVRTVKRRRPDWTEVSGPVRLGRLAAGLAFASLLVLPLLLWAVH